MKVCMLNADKRYKWKEDINASVDQFNKWFIDFAPETYRDTRKKTACTVSKVFEYSNDLRKISPEVLIENPNILQILRMTTAPPMARDRLIGLAHANKNLVQRMEKDGKLPIKMKPDDLTDNLSRICNIITSLLDLDLFPWISQEKKPTTSEKRRAASIIADRLCGAISDPIIRNAQEQRQLMLIAKFLNIKGYKYIESLSNTPLSKIPQGSYTFRMNVPSGRNKTINIPIDVVIQPKVIQKNQLPYLIEAKSAGDFTNVNKRRKEEATKIRQLKIAYGKNIQFILFLCGYFDIGYLEYEASEGLDWIWEHRISDFNKLEL